MWCVVIIGWLCSGSDVGNDPKDSAECSDADSRWLLACWPAGGDEIGIGKSVSDANKVGLEEFIGTLSCGPPEMSCPSPSPHLQSSLNTLGEYDQLLKGGSWGLSLGSCCCQPWKVGCVALMCCWSPPDDLQAFWHSRIGHTNRAGWNSLQGNTMMKNVKWHGS